MSDTLDRDLAIIGRQLQSSWKSLSDQYPYNKTLYRELFNGKRWFRSCCGTRMWALLLEFIAEGTENLDPRSRLREYRTDKRHSICLRCGARHKEDS